MKKFLKVAGIVCIAILIWAAVLAGFLFLFSNQAKKNINEMAKNKELNTVDSGETGEADAETPNISINITDGGVPNQGGDSETYQYYDTMQEALLYATIHLEMEEQYWRDIDEVIKELESDEYAFLFYRSVKNKREEALNYAYFQIQYSNGGKKQYSLIEMSGSTLKYNSFFPKDTAIERIRGAIWINTITEFGVNPNTKRFACGMIRETFLEEGESIYHLKIEGQEPDEIIEFESFGKTWYFWYYNDLYSDKSYTELKIDLEP